LLYLDADVVLLVRKHGVAPSFARGQRAADRGACAQDLEIISMTRRKGAETDQRQPDECAACVASA
jgi:hypothetical protein